MRPEKQRSHTAVDFVNWHLYVHTTSSNPFPTFDSSLTTRTLQLRSVKPSTTLWCWARSSSTSMTQSWGKSLRHVGSLARSRMLSRMLAGC